MPTREERLLDAAITVLGTGGLRRLTHRAVDSAAGLPLGSTSNRFRTRDALLIGVLGRILDRETEIWEAITADDWPATIDDFAELVARLLDELSSAGRTLSLARRTIFVEAGVHPVLGAEINRAQRELTEMMAPILEQLGSVDPAGHVGHLLALVDGLLDHQLSAPARDLDPAIAVAALLRGLVEHP